MSNLIEYIKDNFEKYYIDNGPENGILQGTKYAGAATHCRSCLNALVRMLTPETILEIGSWHYDSSISMSKGMYSYSETGTIHSFDIKRGGYDGLGSLENLPSNISPMFWYPYHTNYDDWKYTDKDIVFKDFLDYTNDEIYEKNHDILKKVAPKTGYDLIFLDGDHSYEGVLRDFEHIQPFCNKNTVVVIDNIWDSRLSEVRRFYDDLKYVKWDFESWNDTHPNNVQDTGVCILKEIDK